MAGGKRNLGRMRTEEMVPGGVFLSDKLKGLVFEADGGYQPGGGVKLKLNYCYYGTILPMIGLSTNNICRYRALKGRGGGWEGEGIVQ